MTKPNGKHPGGRPEEYTPEIAAELCKRVSEGRSLREVCSDDDMPSKTTFFHWLAKHPEFAVQYAPAREACLEHHAEDMVEIADDGTNDWMMRNDPENPGWLANHEHINRSRLRIDTRKWLLSKLLPKKYGDKVDVTTAPGVSHDIPLEQFDPEDLAVIAAVLERARAKQSKPNGKVH